MKMQVLLLPASLAIFVGYVSGCNRRDAKWSADVVDDSHPRISVGMSQTEVLHLLGTPTRKWTRVESSVPGFGEPSWWRKELGDGDKVEAWEYESDEGSDTLYFLRGSAKVAHTRFVKKGIVF